jgi:glycosyltransferase involved in cell wall biosynthesis
MTPRLLYVANIRLPTEKAHGLQIMQNCEAFADAGAQVTLWVARRVNTPEMRPISDVWAHYGVKRNFTVRYIPCLDLMPLAAGRNNLFSRLVFQIQAITFLVMVVLRALLTHAEAYYSRDALVVLALSVIKPRKTLAYEPHTLALARGARWLQRRAVRRAGSVIPVTPKLGDDLAALLSRDAQVEHEKFLVAHDGIRRERFANVPSQTDARREIGWSPEAFIVGYVGRLRTMAMDKGITTLIAALKQVEGASLALVGGPDDIAADLRRCWVESGLEAARFLYAGQVPPDRVPLYLSAFDVCALPLPWTPHFAFYASPIKLFEYMASGRVLIASDLPAIADVVKHEESALLVPPGDGDALAEAVRRLRDDPALRMRLAAAAYTRVMANYTWEARARAILAKVWGEYAGKVES